MPVGLRLASFTRTARNGFVAALVIAAATFALACTRSTRPVENEFASAADEEVALSIRSPVQLSGNSELRLLEVRDSRCPTGVECVWAGEVTGVISFRDDAGAKEFQLTDNSEKNTALLEGWKFELLGVDPHPGKENMTIPQEDYRVRLRISRIEK